MFQSVTVVGRLTKDPEHRSTSGGTAVLNFELAANSYYPSKDGQRKEETCFFHAVVWGKLADNCQRYLQKGSTVHVQGRMVQERYEKDGQKREAWKLRADSVLFLKGTKVQPGGG